MQSDFKEYYDRHPQVALRTDVLHLDEIALAVVKATNHTWRYVIAEMPAYEMFGVYAAVQRQRRQMAEAAKDNPMALLALMMM